MQSGHKITRGEAVDIFTEMQSDTAPDVLPYSPELITEVMDVINDCRVLPFPLLPDLAIPALLRYLFNNGYYVQYCIVAGLTIDA